MQRGSKKYQPQLITNLINTKTKPAHHFVPVPVVQHLPFFRYFLKHNLQNLYFNQQNIPCKTIHFFPRIFLLSGNRPGYLNYFLPLNWKYNSITCYTVSFIYTIVTNGNQKKSRKAKKPLRFRIIKIIGIVLLSAIMLMAIVNVIIHYYRHITH